jgi:hypothetical protein
MRSVIFVSTAVSTNMWHSLDTDSGDLTAIRLKTDTGTIDIYNIYNDINNDGALHSLARAIQKNSSNERADHSIWVGDFNRLNGTTLHAAPSVPLDRATASACSGSQLPIPSPTSVSAIVKSYA